MGLSINQNIAAVNSYRNLSNTQNDLSKSLEKLSSGFRINRAADDAAGLAISEGLRSQVGGLKVAARNAQDGVSVVQTAEGALTEVHSILQRVRDLAVQAGNDSNNTDARTNIKTESDSLVSELDRIAIDSGGNRARIADGQRHVYAGVVAVGQSAGELPVVVAAGHDDGRMRGVLHVADVALREAREQRRVARRRRRQRAHREEDGAARGAQVGQCPFRGRPLRTFPAGGGELFQHRNGLRIAERAQRANGGELDVQFLVVHITDEELADVILLLLIAGEIRQGSKSLRESAAGEFRFASRERFPQRREIRRIIRQPHGADGRDGEFVPIGIRVQKPDQRLADAGFGVASQRIDRL